MSVPAPIAYAETHVDSETVTNNTSWTKDGSPYILDESISIPSGQNLYIWPGVTVTASSTPDNPISIFASGNLTVAGTADEPVTIQGLDSMTFSRSNVSISHADISLPDGIDIFYGTTTIASSTIHGASDLDIGGDSSSDGAGTSQGNVKAISAWGSTLTILDSSIVGNDYGIYSYHVSPGPFLSLMGNFFDEIVGAHAMADVVDDPKQNHISISGSDIVGNHSYGIYNATSNVINAQNNWWGDTAGPRMATDTTGATDASATTNSVAGVTSGGGDSVYGPADTVPWLTKDPLDPPATSTVAVCCSNVLFLPGIEGSRLYVDEPGVGGAGGTMNGGNGFFGTSTNKLWEPNRNADVEKLFMSDSGQSIDPSIYTKDVMDSAYGFGIYNNFIAMMNGVVAEKTINAWEPFAYDWRFGVDSIVNSRSKLLSDFQSLASTSKTGKVTIVAHSDGGLVAKMLGEKLADRGKAGLLDKVILVAVPELGTPEAIAGLLHGDDEDILGGLILGKDTARELGDNAPGAYGLLPSKNYFNAVASEFSSSLPSHLLQPIVSFASSTLASADFHLTGNSQTISTYTALRDFLAGIADHRNSSDSTAISGTILSATSPSDTMLPTVLHVSMIDNAQNIHDSLDAFSFASSTEVLSLIGVGNPTLASVHYFEETHCPLTNTFVGIYRTQPCTDSLVHTASTTLFGDGTVVDVSAKGVNVKKNYYFNLYENNKGKMMPDDHMTILNSASGIAFVKDQVTEPTTVEATSSAPQELSLPPHITATEPTLADLHEDNLVITMHSPVDVNMYDSQGRHTGPIANPDPTSDLGRYEENIPGSVYDPEAVGGTSVTVPYSTDYKVVLNGTGSGTFTLDTEHDVDSVSVASTEFADMPATPLLKAELILATTTGATTSQLLIMDIDGDGTIDATTTPGKPIDPTAYLHSMERTIRSFGLSAYREKVMCDKIEKIIGYILAKKPIKVDEKAAAPAGEALSDIHNQHWIFKNLDQVKKDKLINMFQSILDSAEI